MVAYRERRSGDWCVWLVPSSIRLPVEGSRGYISVCYGTDIIAVTEIPVNYSSLTRTVRYYKL